MKISGNSGTYLFDNYGKELYIFLVILIINITKLFITTIFFVQYKLRTIKLSIYNDDNLISYLFYTKPKCKILFSFKAFLFLCSASREKYDN